MAVAAAEEPAESVSGATDLLVCAALSSAALKAPCFAFCPGLGLSWVFLLRHVTLSIYDS